MTAVSGASGGWLWTYSLDEAFTAIPNESLQRSAAIVGSRRAALVAVTDGTQWIGLDPETGRPKEGRFDLGFVPIRQVQHVDLDGDGEPEILALEHGPAARQNTLHAFSISSGRELWSAPSDEAHIQFRTDEQPPEFPLIVDLDGDGFSEIVVPASGAVPSLSRYRGVKLVDGRTGKPRWRRVMSPDTGALDGLTAAIVAPDLNGDGTKDLVTVSHFAAHNGQRRLPSSRKKRSTLMSTRSREKTAAWCGGGASICPHPGVD